MFCDGILVCSGVGYIYNKCTCEFVLCETLFDVSSVSRVLLVLGN